MCLIISKRRYGDSVAKRIGKMKSFIGIGLAGIPILFLLISQPLSAAEPKLKVAVLDFGTVGDSEDLGRGAAEILRTTLVETGKYKIIERRMLKQVLEEQKLSLGGVIDQKEAAGIGKLLGAKLVAVGSVVRLGESYTLNIRFVDVETGEVVSGRKLTTKSKEDIPALCGKMVKLLSSGKGSPQKDEVFTPVPIQKPIKQEPAAKTYTPSTSGGWALGLIYPGGAVKHTSQNHAWELKAQAGSGIMVVGPRYYRYITSSGLRLYWGLEADYINFTGKESKGGGYAGGGFVGGEIPLGDKLGLAMDCGPMYINLAETKYSQSASGMEYVLNMTIYWHFR